MTRIALCFSGAIRNFKNCIPFIKKYVIDGLGDLDIFIHMWNVDKIDNDLETKFKLRVTDCSTKYVIDVLKPKKYVIDEYTSEWETKIRKESGVDWSKFKSEKDKKYAFNACGMYYKIMKCNELKSKYEEENNFKYDIVIRARTDYIFTDYIYLTDIIDIKKDSSLVIIPNDRYNCLCRAFKYSNDKFFMGSSDLMNNLCNIFHEIKNTTKCTIDGQSLFRHYAALHSKKIAKINDHDLYYKCTGKKVLLENHTKKIFIKNNGDILTEYLTFKFSSKGYSVTTDKINDDLKLFFNLKQKNFTKYQNYDFTIGIKEGKDKKNVTINITTKSGDDYEYMIENIYNSSIKLDDNVIFYEEIFDFILSTISYSKPNKYKISKSKMIIPKIGENIIYQIPDRGFFANKIKEICKNIYKMEKSIMKFSIAARKSIKICKIYDYYEDGVLPSNYPKDYLIKKYTKIRLNNLVY